MNARLFTVMVSSAMALPAIADSGFTPGKGESSGSYHLMPSTRSVEQTKAELAAWQRNPVSADGFRQIRGDPGWIYVGTGRSERTRAQVQQEVAEFQRDKVTSDGWTMVTGEIGWAQAGPHLGANAVANSRGARTAPVALGQRPTR